MKLHTEHLGSDVRLLRAGAHQTVCIDAFRHVKNPWYCANHPDGSSRRKTVRAGHYPSAVCYRPPTCKTGTWTGLTRSNAGRPMMICSSTKCAGVEPPAICMASSSVNETGAGSEDCL